MKANYNGPTQTKQTSQATYAATKLRIASQDELNEAALKRAQADKANAAKMQAGGLGEFEYSDIFA